jgi:type III restriction enzyme
MSAAHHLQTLTLQIARYMSLREPQSESLQVLHEIADGLDFRSATLAQVAVKASEMSRGAKPVEFDTAFPSFCFALATGVGKTRLMGASIYYLWKSKGYRNFFILAPGMTIYDKLRAELSPAHPKYMFVGLSDFPAPDVYDGDNYLRFAPGLFDETEERAHVFVFNIGKIFSRTDVQFKFHKFNENLGAAFSDVLKQMGDLVVLMDESHRYRGSASLRAINALKPALGLEFTATPTHKGNVIYSFGLAQAIGRFVKSPTVVTRTNLTTSDKEEMDKLKLLDGMTRHEIKKARLAEYCAANQKEMVKPFVLISTRDTTHAREIRARVESDSFCEGRYKGKVIQIHSGLTGAESDENIQKLLEVEHPTSSVEVVIHVNMLKEGWDVKNLYTIVPLRASVEEILVEQTIGRGLRLPFGVPTGIADLDELEIMSHDNYARLIQAAKDSPLFHIKVLSDDDRRQVKSVQVQPKFLDMGKVLDRAGALATDIFTYDKPPQERIDAVVEQIVAEQAAAYEQAVQVEAARPEDERKPVLQTELFSRPDVVTEKGFDREKAFQTLRDDFKLYLEKAIQVPHLVVDVKTERDFTPFAVKVTRGPYLMVEQIQRIADLATGKTRDADKAELLGIDNPRGFLAAQLIDAIEEMAVASDKDVALKLADDYLAQIGCSPDDVPKIVHLYRDTIVDDLRTQVEVNLKERTDVTYRLHKGFVKFRPYSKSVLVEHDGIRNCRDDTPKADVPRYLFTGFTKTIYPLVPFDSTPEKDLAIVLEDDGEVLKWVRPPEGNMPIFLPGGSYNPDFIVETADRKYVVEVKARNELVPVMDAEVRTKAEAAEEWCAEASKLPGSKPWEYKLVPDDVVKTTLSLAFIISQAIRVDQA